MPGGWGPKKLLTPRGLWEALCSMVKSRTADESLVDNAGHNNVTCADYGCYAQWSATTVAFL